MKWDTISRIYEAIIGKVIVLFGVISIITIPTPLKLMIEGWQTSILLLGAIILSISYGLYKISIPDLISYYKTPGKYVESILNQYKNNLIDIYSEFSLIENKDNLDHIKKLFSSNPVFQVKILNLESIIKDLEEGRAIKYMAEIKYSLVNNQNILTRICISFSFFIGILMMYWPSIVRIYSTLKGGLS